jgi:hypothetical protein
MSKLKRSSLLLFLLSLMVSTPLGTIATRAQDIIPPGKFLIRNRSREHVTFWLRKGGGPWSEYHLAPGADDLYGDYDQVWFRPPGYDAVYRGVKLGQRYKIIFDGSRWDFVMIDPDQIGQGAASREEQPTRPALSRGCLIMSQGFSVERLDPGRPVPAVRRLGG